MMSESAGRLVSRGIKPSYQRVRILDYLAGTKAHPSAETIYQGLAPELPTLSRTTVYNTLRLFAEKGLVLQLLLDEAEARYDGDTSPHGHFRCRGCGRVLDFPLAADLSPPTLPAGFRLERAELSCVGLCPSCAKALAPPGE
ncbi:MAG: transcriptional repressor [Spirochaetaceae bacterium]|nr:transcriptional repressor [Spirochaetaceae bacterium]